jgi:hypothetical protein
LPPVFGSGKRKIIAKGRLKHGIAGVSDGLF